MSLGSAQAFVKKVNRNVELQSQIEACISEKGIDFQAIQAIGRREGYDFTPQEYETAMSAGTGGWAAASMRAKQARDRGRFNLG